MARKRVLGSELRVGDVMDVIGRRLRITGLRPYTGPLAHLFPDGAQLADYDQGPGMTIDNRAGYDTFGGFTDA